MTITSVTLNVLQVGFTFFTNFLILDWFNIFVERGCIEIFARTSRALFIQAKILTPDSVVKFLIEIPMKKKEIEQ